ncbi:30S ribosome-binding factor RbfA [Phenylobacterium sp.]|uniref:30S ribosome-binding factor RbfA n=1 Tax=Phenylobacterium sp. TaxID=1871053 RepID=UPI00286C9DA0|nr:30S ribosome-binding factor RbfA [Phenylobacterium sp.]
MKRPAAPTRAAPRGPSQRQLRAGELMRHALVEILRADEISDPVLAGASVTLTEVRMSPDLRNATIFVEPLGGGERSHDIVKALNRHHKFLRGRLGHAIDMKFTPALKFLHDESFDQAARMTRLFQDPRVAQDLAPDAPPGGSLADQADSPGGQD